MYICICICISIGIHVCIGTETELLCGYGRTLGKRRRL